MCASWKRDRTAVVLGAAEEILPEDLPGCLLETVPSFKSGGEVSRCGQREQEQLVLQALEQANGYYIDAAKILGCIRIRAPAGSDLGVDEVLSSAAATCAGRTERARTTLLLAVPEIRNRRLSPGGVRK